MIEHIVIAVVIAVIVGLLCIFGGRILKSLSVPPAVTVGGFFEEYAWPIGVLVGIVWFITNGSFRL